MMAEGGRQMAEGKKQRATQLAAKGFFAFEDLEVYQLSVELAAAVYVLTTALPPDERFGLTNQIRRAVTSITLNIAEGRGRGTDKDFARFLTQARGSLYEAVSGLQLAVKLGYLTNDQTVKVNERARELSAKLTAFTNKLGAV